MKNIWKTLPKPILALAPMHGATDTVFRQIVASIGKPDVSFTEFLCVDQLYSFSTKTTEQLLEYSELERPLVAQIWGTMPELFYNASQILVELGFDGVDINMGCPEKSAVKSGACSALIKTPSLAAEIIAATREGLAGKIPLSVKTRIGFEKIVTEEWIEFLLKLGLDALTVHGRTAKEMSLVPAHWDEIGKAVEIRNSLGLDTVILGNGDVDTIEQAEELVAQYGVDGVMIGRGVFHDPFVFNPSRSIHELCVDEKLDLLISHVKLFEAAWGSEKNYAELKRFYKIYVNGFDGAAHAREQLMQTSTYAEAYAAVAAIRAEFTER